MHATSLSKADYQTTELLRQLKPAGSCHNGMLETAKDALTWQDRPATPEELKPYQHYARQPAGTILKHFGTARDPVAHGPFGVKTKTSEQSAAECMAVYPQSEMARWKLERSEDVYARYATGCSCFTHRGRLQCTQIFSHIALSMRVHPNVVFGAVLTLNTLTTWWQHTFSAHQDRQWPASAAAVPGSFGQGDTV